MATAELPVVAPKIKPRREDVPADVVLCEHCTAKCCRYFALPIDKPEDRQAFDYIRWFLLHEHATVFVDEGDWYLLVHTPCKHLRADHLCGIYTTRPPICREYTTDNCEYEDDWVYDQYFETAEQVVEFVEATLGSLEGNIRSPKPPLLPLL
ncbi:MAG: YkgJ family cysteine cluster protein [Planctomycetota bacterium]|nr:YkgJ family cysteine cluster protein [Planctomycetota bacterium]